MGGTTHFEVIVTLLLGILTLLGLVWRNVLRPVVIAVTTQLEATQANTRAIIRMEARLSSVERLVDGHSTAQERRVEQLGDALTAKDVKIPRRPRAARTKR